MKNTIKQGFLLDENIGYVVLEFLRREGYDAKSILEGIRSISDDEVLEGALMEKRILVTLDKDFGELVYRYSKKHAGVIFLRLKKESPENIIKVLTQVLEMRATQLMGRFVIASEVSMRVRQS
ncbi:MAG: DUF5615 family PIN-like protein [Nanoarchaeota archaeon]|nr:DUF5615 family PIN-like protein [Nanoarchaeota archaeon]